MANFLMVDGYHGPSKNPQYPNSFEVLAYGVGELTRNRSRNEPPHKDGDFYFIFTNIGANFAFATANKKLPIKKIVLVATEPGGGSAKASEYLRMTLTDSFIAYISISPEAFQVGINFSNSQILYGVEPPPHGFDLGLESVQPKHWHMIQHLLSKAGQQLGSKAGGKR